MKRWLKSTLTVLMCTVGAAICAPAAGDEVQQLRATVQALQEQVKQLKASAADDQWLTEHRASEIRALVHEVLADADTRASLLGSSITAGWDNGFKIGSSDGNFLLKIGGQIQVRYVYNHSDESPDLDGDQHRAGFEVRRSKIEFAGHVVDPSWTYKVKGAFDRSDGAFNLEDAVITKKLGGGWSVSVGQFKPPFLREELVSSSKQLAVDRSLVNEERNQDFAQGVTIAYAGDVLRASAMYHDGFGSDNTGWHLADTEFALTGRAEALLAGSWKQFDDFTSFRGDDFGFMIGAAAHYQKGEYGFAGAPPAPLSGTFTAGMEETEFMWTVDASVEFGGANLFAAVVGRHLDVADADRIGFVLQGGAFIVDDWELFGRYEWYDFDAPGVEDLSVVTVGVNKYFAKHALKWTTDLGYGINRVDPTFGSTGVGWRGDAAEADGQVVFRSQLQLLF